MITKDMLFDCYQQLLQEYGEGVRYWPQWCAKKKSPAEREKIIIGMILVQRTSWHNANLALKNLKKTSLLSLKKIAGLKNLDHLTALCRPAGFYSVKPCRLYDLSCFILENGGIEKLLEEKAVNLRKRLLNLKGIGPETADTILLYALDKPVFIIDEYTRRWVVKEKLTDEKDYLKLQSFFERNLPKDLVVYQNFHALIIVAQKGPAKSIMEIV
ncbi:MAG: endonuclease [Candidatus Shapirobacteria bacterium]